MATRWQTVFHSIIFYISWSSLWLREWQYRCVCACVWCQYKINHSLTVQMRQRTKLAIWHHAVLSTLTTETVTFTETNYSWICGMVLICVSLVLCQMSAYMSQILVHVCLSTSLVLTVPTNRGIARLSWPNWLVIYWNVLFTIPPAVLVGARQ